MSRPLFILGGRCTVKNTSQPDKEKRDWLECALGTDMLC